MKRIALIDYGSGNLRSAAKAFEREAGKDAVVTVSADPAALKEATHIVLPGVGAFGDCMRGLAAVPGMLEALETQVRACKKPFLGVCVGMQMLFQTGFEHGRHAGLGWLEGEVVRLKPADATLKIPHMGWNVLTSRAHGHPLLEGIRNGAHAYFVHSYHAVCDPGIVLAVTDYGGPVTAVVGYENILGTQFHPEKSQEAGLRLIRNFLAF